MLSAISKFIIGKSPEKGAALEQTSTQIEEHKKVEMPKKEIPQTDEKSDPGSHQVKKIEPSFKPHLVKPSLFPKAEEKIDRVKEATRILKKCIVTLTSSCEDFNSKICSQYILAYARYFAQASINEKQIGYMHLIAYDAYGTYLTFFTSQNQLALSELQNFSKKTDIQKQGDLLKQLNFAHEYEAIAAAQYVFSDIFLQKFMEIHVKIFDKMKDVDLPKMVKALLEFIESEFSKGTVTPLTTTDKCIPNPKIAKIFNDGVIELEYLLSARSRELADTEVSVGLTRV